LYLATDEKTHTTNYYDEIVHNQIMHYGRVNDKLYVGGCPRTLKHIEDELAKELGVTAVVNLQVKKDIERNCQSILGDSHVPEPNNEYDLASVDILRKAYEQAGILFLWVPITDMSSTGRELMSPQAALVLKTILEKGHRVYVHCNAGKSFEFLFKVKKKIYI
jgi:atypical dual specificity phosphatase